MAFSACGLYHKCFMIVIHYCNDRGLYYKTTILADLAFAWSVKYGYDHKGCCKTEVYFYDHRKLQFTCLVLVGKARSLPKSGAPDASLR
jgi:hypothetical protein